MTLCNGDFSHQLWCSLKISFFLPFALRIRVLVIWNLNTFISVAILHPKLSTQIFYFSFIWFSLKSVNFLLYLLQNSSFEVKSQLFCCGCSFYQLGQPDMLCSWPHFTRSHRNKSMSSTVIRIYCTFSAVWPCSKVLSAKAMLFYAYYLIWNPWLRFIDPCLLFQLCQEQDFHLFGVLLAVKRWGWGTVSKQLLCCVLNQLLRTKFLQWVKGICNASFCKCGLGT